MKMFWPVNYAFASKVAVFGLQGGESQF